MSEWRKRNPIEFEFNVSGKNDYADLNQGAQAA